MSFYDFRQNNSGGEFDFDKKLGITHFVIVEADSEEDAIKRAEDIGLYFNGIGDCSCCGNRWYSDFIEASDTPTLYGKPAEKYMESELAMKWMKGPEIYVHYKDGRIVGLCEKG
jgi:hypothetical protein